MDNSQQEYKDPNDRSSEMTTLDGCLRVARTDGYTVDFCIEAGQLFNEALVKRYYPSEVAIANFYRFEGDSDPADEAVLYLIQTNDGHKGVLIDAYGIYATSHINMFIQQVKAIQKVNKGEGL
jgi:hypothetical protein